MHLPYRCRDSGACCTSGWPIPLEAARVPSIAAAIGNGRLHTPTAWLRPVSGQPADVAGVLTSDASGHCLFHAAGCEIQRVLGHDALPSACQHFPRRCLLDARGVSVTLSHYCPTAASLLFEHSSGVEIVAGPSPIGGDPEGLDARDALPPLLTPERLMDYPDYGAWEAHMVRVLAGDADDPRSPEDVLALLYEHAETISTWRPGNASLGHAIRSLAFDDQLDTAGLKTRPRRGSVRVTALDCSTERRLVGLARSSLVSPCQWPQATADEVVSWQSFVEPEWAHYSVVIKRFMAAHAFASWMAYEGTGVLSIVRVVHLALAVLRQEVTRVCKAENAPLDAARLKHGIRQTDLLLVHLADYRTLARRISSS
jgi:hypothetical protein